MFPFLPVLILGGGLVIGAKLGNRLKLGKKLRQRIHKADERYQQLFQEKIDPLFGAKERIQQMQEFTGDYNAREADINRRISMSVVNTKLALLGAMFYTPLSWLSAAGLITVMWPLMRNSLKVLLREKRLKYLLVANLSIVGGIASGYYIISNLMSVVVFLAFKVAARTEAYSQSMLLDAFTLQPPGSVWVQANGVETEICFNDLKTGDIIVLFAGQVIPVDGEVVEGAAAVDQHMLTGESQPLEKTTADRVFANTLLLTGKLYVRVEQTGNETAAAQIGQIFRGMGTHRLEHEARSEQLADKLTLPVLAASGLALMTVGPSGAVAIMNSGFGSTLFFSGPLSMLSHLNLASHQGILVKDGRSLEQLHEVDTVVFDKTGTLTLEQPEVSAIHCFHNWEAEQVLTYAALAEHRQSHPIAKAIRAYAAQQGIREVQPDSATYEVGFGIKVHHHGHTIRVGSLRFMTQSSIAIPPDVVRLQEHCRDVGSSLIMVAVDEELAGALELQAQLRPETAELVTRLHQRGLKLCILSGDHLQPTRHLAQRLGIDDFFAEVLPEGKADIIRQLQEKGQKICFVGDGINDAIALRQANVSVSLRGATTIATDSAQIILMQQSLLQLDQLFEIARDFNKNLDQTVRLAYIPGSILIGGVFILHFGMPAALLLYGTGVTMSISKALSPLRRMNSKSNLIKKEALINKIQTSGKTGGQH